MKLIIAGGRQYRFTHEDRMRLDQTFIQGVQVTEVISGCASGADKHGEHWALSRGILIKYCPADWGHDGKAAGAIRNETMARYADAVVLFPGGKGTQHMYKEAVKRGLKIYDWREKYG